MVDRDGIETFLAVWQERSFTKAAARLHRSQAAVSQRIQGLERELGAKLFERHASGVACTPAGEVLKPLADRIVGLLQEVEDSVADAQRPLRLGCPGSIAAARLGPVLSAVASEGAAVSISTGHSPELMLDLLDGRLDAGVLLEHPAPSGLAWLPWGTSAVVAVTGAPQGPGSWANLAGRPVVLYSFGPGCSELAEAVAAAGARVIVPKASPLSLALDLVRDGGLTFVPRAAVPPHGPWRWAAWPELDRFGWRVGLMHRERAHALPAFRVLRAALERIPLDPWRLGP